MKKDRQYRSNQGRSPEQQEANYKIMFFAGCGMAVVFGLLIVVELVSRFF